MLFFTTILPITILLVLLIVVAVVLARFYTEKKYNDFVWRYSVCLKQLSEINSQYNFYPYVNVNQSHTYDNEKLYDTVSCRDYLIYQLQYIRQTVFSQIKKISANRQQYFEYLAKVNSITQLGRFEVSVEKFNTDKLLQKEKELIKKQTLSTPITQFVLIVTLYCSTLNGRVYDEKSATFNARDIYMLVKRLDNKSGDFYNDREIWDALCRVERAKVSNKMRFSIYARDGHRCCKCGISDRYAPLEIDHIIPISKGGKSTYDNLQTLCHKCNVEKGNEWKSSF